MRYKTQLDEWQDGRHTRLQAVQFWLSTPENRHGLRDLNRYRRLSRDLDEAQRLHGLCRSHEYFPNDRIIPRLRAELEHYRPAELRRESADDITDADLKALLGPVPAAPRSRAARTTPWKAPAAKLRWIAEAFGEAALCHGSLKCIRASGGTIYPCA